MSLNALYRAGGTVASLLLLAGRLSAQSDPRNPDVRSIATLAREQGHTGPAVDVLRRRIGRRSAAELDAIADTLLAIALAEPGASPAAVRLRGEARTALILAGAANHEGTPYPGAAERLVHLAKAGPSGGAVYGLTLLPDRAQAVQLVAEVAQYDGYIAKAAVGHLGRSLGADGLTRLRELYRRRLVVDASARQEMESMARYHGWDRGNN